MTVKGTREELVATQAATGAGPQGDGAVPRTLAEDLRARGDEAIVALLRVRPDLVSPVPNDLTQLATRAGTRASVVRALERLDRFTLQTAEALAVAADPCPYDELLGLMSGDTPDPEVVERLPRAVAALRTGALVWGTQDRLRLVRTARDLLAPSASMPSPTGLGPAVAEAAAGMSPGRVQEILADAGLPSTHDAVSAVAALRGLFGDRRRMAALLDGAPPEAAGVLDRLVWGPPYGEVAKANVPVRAADAVTPVQWLLARGLLLPAGPNTVVLPREAALHLRGGRAHRVPEPVAPAVTPRATYPVATVDATAAGEAFTATRTVEELLKAWETGGPPVLRAGGVSVRDLKRTAATLDVDERQAAFWLELAYAAGLVATDGEADEVFAPTPAFDAWLAAPAERRWAALVSAWLPSTRTPGLVGDRDSRGRTLAALGPDLDRSSAPEIRRRVLRLLADLPPGASADADVLLTRLRWERPQRSASGGAASGGPGGWAPGGSAGAADAPGADRAAGARDGRARLVRWTVEQAEVLGVTGRGALASYARQLAGADAGEAAVDEAAAVLAGLLPEPLDHVLLQADLTAVAPGPLLAPLAEFLGVAADIESKGGATVYRFTPESVRRALDAGRSADDLHTFLAAHSRTPAPQPLTYLIDDVARRHGHLRVGAASAYLRCDDDHVLAEILADKRSAPLGLRRLAPTVLAARVAPGALLERLRAMGYAPAAESADGDVLITRADAHRTPPRAAPVPVPDGPAVPPDRLLATAVKAIRAGDRAAAAVRPPDPPSRPGAPQEQPPRTSAAETLATVQAAVLTGEPVWIGYVNAEGAASQRVIEPVRVEGGYVTAYDRTAEGIRRFSLHRVTGVRELADEAP
ncbi:helicase-associated domain-containing protein [Streptomyces sp. SL13]|uniref:Helicase-associated domain-containing protein n=1 Tax=Streptantibioticus silvisoli TaxID=2705255 RepID=A0AA90H7Y8_9ACTN|nr:helicase-associated domain-containing protein [Streptantibioticus silvisoli]MDI5969592.1 helicase-associated domain-containing protein [Streptantibioticus silvisoli]